MAVFQPSASPAPRKIFPLRNSDGKVRNLLYVPEQGDNAAIVVASDKGVLKVLREKEVRKEDFFVFQTNCSAENVVLFVLC